MSCNNPYCTCCPRAYVEGLQDGYKIGYTQGFRRGYVNGYVTGYLDSAEDAPPRLIIPPPIKRIKHDLSYLLSSNDE